MKVIFKTILASAAFVMLPSSAQAQIETSREVLDAEVAAFPEFLQVAIKDYAGRLIAQKDNFSKMDVSNCHFSSDTTTIVMQAQQDEVAQELFYEWVVRSRALAYLSLEKFEDHLKPLGGSYAEKIVNDEMSFEELVQILPVENSRCTALLSAQAGPVIREMDTE